MSIKYLSFWNSPSQNVTPHYINIGSIGEGSLYNINEKRDGSESNQDI